MIGNRLLEVCFIVCCLSSAPIHAVQLVFIYFNLPPIDEHNYSE